VRSPTALTRAVFRAGSGYTIAPRIRHDGEEKNDSLLTYILHIDLMPNRLSLAWQRLNRIDLLEDLLMNVLGARPHTAVQKLRIGNCAANPNQGCWEAFCGTGFQRQFRISLYRPV
jgi:hypothetical protein